MSLEAEADPSLSLGGQFTGNVRHNNDDNNNNKLNYKAP